MSIVPPRCPNRSCRQHTNPARDFYVRRGWYRPRCRDRAIQRFLCRSCRRSFSTQTFRIDYRDRRPDANDGLLRLSASGVGLRQAGRLLGLTVFAVQHKQAKLARALQHLHRNLSAKLPPDRTFLLDEEESYEGASIRPLTVPIVIDRETWFVVAMAVGPIRRLAPVGTARRRRQELDERRRGRRSDESRRRVREVLLELDRRTTDGSLQLQTDEKASYRNAIRQLFGERATHVTVSGAAPRTTRNLLFPINTTIAMTRDNCSRLRRRSWLVAKSADGLRAHTAIFTVYRNYVRRRFNRDRPGDCAASLLGLVPRAMTFEEVLRWRQDWGARSPSPLCPLGRATVGDARPAAA